MIAGVAIVVVAGAAVLLVRRSPKGQPNVPKTSAPVTVDPSEVILNGRVTARTVVAIAAPIEGTLQAYFVEIGAEVIHGQLLGRIANPKFDTSAQAAQIDLERTQATLTALNGEQLAARLEVSRAEAEQSRARGELDRLQKAYERQKGLWAAGATARLTFEKSEKEFTDAQATLEKLDSAAKQAGARMDAIAREIDAASRAVVEKTAAIERTKAEPAPGELHSPADGIVIARHAQPGEPVDPSMKNLLEVATDLAALQTSVTPDPAILPRIHAGQMAMVRLGDDDIAGVVQEVRGNEMLVYFTSAAPVTKLDVPVQVKIKF